MRRSFTLCSIVAHAIAISAALIAQVLAVGTLPTPRLPLLFASDRVMPVDVQPAKPPRRARAAEAAAPAVSPNAAPIAPPDGVIRETGNEDRSAPPDSAITGIERGGPAPLIDGVGVTAAVPPPAEPAAPIRLHSGMKAPQKIADAAPLYPAIARSARVQGVVILEAVLNADGGVESVHVLRSIPLLDQAAIDAVRQWRFTPALLNGEPVPVVITVTVNFTLAGR